MRKLWAVYAEDETRFLHQNAVAVGWGNMGDLSLLPADKSAYREKFRAVYPDESAVATAQAVSLLYRLACETQTGDALVCPFGEWIFLGTVTGGYVYDANAADREQSRPVRWLKRLPRGDFSRAALREIGSSPMRIFPVKRFSGEFLEALDNSRAGMAAESPLEDPLAVRSAEEPECAGASEAAETDTRRFILERMRNALNREEFLELIPALLQAMGYQTEAVPGSGGTDLFAVRDAISPRVLVRIHHGGVREEDVGALERAVPAGEFGLLVSLPAFPESVRRVLDAMPCVRGLDGQELAGLIPGAYNDLSAWIRKRIPLRQVYLPDTHCSR